MSEKIKKYFNLSAGIMNRIELYKIELIKFKKIEEEEIYFCNHTHDFSVNLKKEYVHNYFVNKIKESEKELKKINKIVILLLKGKDIDPA